MRWTIYGIRATHGEIVYVGQTVDLTSRERAHAIPTNLRNPALSAWLGGYGRDAEFLNLGEADSKEEAISLEGDLIWDLHPRFNRNGKPPRTLPQARIGAPGPRDMKQVHTAASIFEVSCDGW